MYLFIIIIINKIVRHKRIIIIYYSVTMNINKILLAIIY